jgi:hypothetical protein
MSKQVTIKLADYYCESQIKAIIKVTETRIVAKMNVKITSLGDAVIEQKSKSVSYIIATLMVATSKNITICPAMLSLYSSIGHLLYVGQELKTYGHYACMLGKNLVYKQLEQSNDSTIMDLPDLVSTRCGTIYYKDQIQLMGLIEIFIKQFGVSGVASKGHVKVIDNVMTSETDQNKKYLVLRDPCNFCQLIYEVSVSDPVLLFTYIFTYI